MQRARFLIEQIGEGHRHFHLVAVVGVRDGIGDRHRSRQRDLQLALGMGAGVARFGLMHAALESEIAAHHRHPGFVAVGADAHLDLVGEIDAIDEFQKAMHEMLARHFAVADDVDAGVLLHFDREQRGVELGLREIVTLQPPLRPQSVRLGEPGRFRQAAGDGCRKHHVRQLAF